MSDNTMRQLCKLGWATLVVPVLFGLLVWPTPYEYHRLSTTRFVHYRTSSRPREPGTGLLGGEESPKAKYNLVAGLWDGIMEDKPEPPESQKRAERLTPRPREILYCVNRFTGAITVIADSCDSLGNPTGILD